MHVTSTPKIDQILSWCTEYGLLSELTLKTEMECWKECAYYERLKTVEYQHSINRGATNY